MAAKRYDSFKQAGTEALLDRATQSKPGPQRPGIGSASPAQDPKDSVREEAPADPPGESRRPTYAPLSRIQRLIGARMLASKHGKPCFYLAARADVTELMAMRHQLSKLLGVKITSNAFFLRALAVAAVQYPLMVGRLVHPEPQDSRLAPVIQIPEHVNIGFAVNSPQGLVVPVIQGAEAQTLAQIAEQEKRLTNRARGNKLTLDDLEDPAIGLSNLGAFDIDTFLGIVPPAVSAILTAGKVALTAVPAEGHVVVRKLVSLSLAVDHRITDGAYAARFLHSLTQHLQDPQQLI
jgi:pyruvate dehydrogenase E2 component (dihydrolipoamide acetyltransferase)